MPVPESVQDAYLKIREYFSLPNAQIATHEGGQCQYRTDDGRKCAVGCLISDDEYNVDMEGCGSSDVIRFLNWNVNKHVDHFLYAAQEAHDTSQDVPVFINKLDALYEFCRWVDND